METYTITKGQQYDSDGARVVFGRRGLLTENFDGQGQPSHGDWVRDEHRGEIIAAVQRVIATGTPETLTFGAATAPTDETTTAQPCRDCGTWCDGDCEA